MHDDTISQLRIMLNLGQRQIDRYYVTRLLEAYDQAVEQRGKAADYLLHVSQEWAAEYDKAIRQRDHARAQASEAWAVWVGDGHMVCSELPPLASEDDDGWTP